MKQLLTLVVFQIIIVCSIQAQQVSGQLKHQSGQDIKLLGYKGFETFELAKSTIDSLGDFSLRCTADYNGMAYLETSDKGHLLLVLNEAGIIIKGTSLQEAGSILYENSIENRLFSQYAVEHNQREAALNGWKYLLPQYKAVPQLQKQKKSFGLIQNEILRLESEDKQFLQNINKSTYVSWFLPLRKLIDDMPLSAQRYTERIPQNIADFRSIDFIDSRLYYSGIMDDLLLGHYLLLENMGQSLDSIYIQMNLSTDYLIQNLDGHDELLNKVTDYIFGLLEQRSLFTTSEHLALSMLTQNSCLLEDNLSNKLETYRAMKVGNTASDINFSGTTLKNGDKVNKITTLSELNNRATLVIFGASWCPGCVEDIPQIAGYYKKWKAKGLDIVYISLDTDEKTFTEFTKKFPWLSYCDLQGWESKAAKDYYVFSTPTMFLLDNERKILIRPVSVEHVNAWVEQKMD